MIRRCAVFGMLIVVCLSACGSAPSTASAKAAGQLAHQAQAVRYAVSVGDRAGAAADLAQLRTAVVQLQAQGQLSQAKAQRILADAADVEAQLAGLPAPPAPTTVPATTVPTTAPASDRPRVRDKGNGGGGND